MATTTPYLPAIMTAGIIDISHWQPGHDFTAAAQAGVIAVIAKATQGGSVDPAWKVHAVGARAAGLKLGAYEFLDDSDPNSQADKLADTVADPAIPLFLDAERNPSSQASIATVEQIALRLHDQLDVWPTVYMGRNGPDGTGRGLPAIGLSPCGLWLPEYGKAPICPPGWSIWRLWQYTDGTGEATVPGIGKCDHSRFSGKRDQFDTWWAGLTPSAGAGDGAGGQQSPTPATFTPGSGSGVPALSATLRLGSTGDDVRMLQSRLTRVAGAVANPLFNPNGVDGDFGNQTDAAVRSFQGAYSLVVDGIVMGPRREVAHSGETWSRLWSVAPAG